MVSAIDGATNFRVLIAGGGVAALEAILALRELAGPGLEIEQVCPTEEFTLRALSVAEPFGADEPRALDLAEFAAEHGVTLRRDVVAEVWGRQQRVLLGSGEELFYDAMLLALGGRQRDALRGAHPFRGAHDVGWYSRLLRRLEEGELHRLVFAVPEDVRWSLPLIELALMTAHRLESSGSREVELVYVTHEPAPLEVFGKAVSAHVAGLLAERGIELVTGRYPVSADGGELVCRDGWGTRAPCTVTLPALTVPDLPGLPQGRHGFIACDPSMRVEGIASVWAAGDATWLPIKQGGLAAQQAEVAAASIAAAAGHDVDPVTFEPVVRAALLTGEEPEFLRSRLEDERGTTIARSPLWWPPTKVAGPRLAPYLARAWTGEPTDPLGVIEDFEGGGDVAGREADHREALGLSLGYADVDARENRLEDALRWLEVAEKLNVTLPPGYAERRREWRARVHEESENETTRRRP